MNDTETNNGSQDTGSNTGTLDQDGYGGADADGENSRNLGSLVNNTGRHSHQSTLKDIDQSKQANHKKDQGKKEADTSRGIIILPGGTILEEGGASDVDKKVDRLLAKRSIKGKALGKTNE